MNINPGIHTRMLGFFKGSAIHLCLFIFKLYNIAYIAIQYNT